MNKMKPLLSCIIMSIILFPSRVIFAEASSLPPILRNSYAGLSAGYGNFYYNNQYVNPGYHVNRFHNAQGSINFLIGHYFNPYLAVQINLVRPVYWIQADINKNDKPTISTSVFSAALQPTYPITDKTNINASVGYSYRSRHGITDGNKDIVNNNSDSSFLVGAGVHHIFGQHFLSGIMAQYTFSTKTMPPSFYVGAIGAYYFNSLQPMPNTEHNSDSFFFPKQELALSLYNRKIANVEYPSKIPLFWEGKVKLQNGLSLSYRRSIYHSDQLFSLEWGANFQSMRSQQNNTGLYAISLFPSFRFWFWRTPKANLYFSYTVAGPTYISKNKVNGTQTGKHFTFFDAITLGLIYNKHIDFGLEMAHYSNGNLFPQNPGFCIPLSLHIGYVF